MTWEEVAVFDVGDFTEDYEIAEDIAGKVDEHRCVQVIGEGRYHVEAEICDDVGWKKVADFVWNEGDEMPVAESLADDLPEQYRVIFDYDEGEYTMECYHE